MGRSPGLRDTGARRRSDRSSQRATARRRAPGAPGAAPSWARREKTALRHWPARTPVAARRSGRPSRPFPRSSRRQRRRGAGRPESFRLAAQAGCRSQPARGRSRDAADSSCGPPAGSCSRRTARIRRPAAPTCPPERRGPTCRSSPSHNPRREGSRRALWCRPAWTPAPPASLRDSNERRHDPDACP